ncbi:MAG: NHL repeat-containing protein [Bacteroidia bacterium]
MKTKIVLLIILLIIAVSIASAQAIGTVAGNGISGYGGDNGPVAAAELNHPIGIAFDKQGNAYVADANNNRVRKINPDGIISTFAGDSKPGYSGDGGPATLARLNYPSGVACDEAGNVYVADMENSVIRKINKDGIITTVAGTGVAGFGGDKKAATAAMLNDPSSVTVDNNGNLYIADYGNNRIRKVNKKGVIYTIAGNGKAGYSGDKGQAISAELNSPASVVCDKNGNLFIADVNNNCVRKININGFITTVAGVGSQEYSGDGELAVNAGLYWPESLAIDEEGNLYIADSGNHVVRKMSSDGKIYTLTDNGNLKNEEPAAVAFDMSGTLYIAYDTFSMICRTTRH